jgi:immune inhibitor A
MSHARTYSCPNCHAKLEVGGEESQVTCRNCGNVVSVPRALRDRAAEPERRETVGAQPMSNTKQTPSSSRAPALIGLSIALLSCCVLSVVVLAYFGLRQVAQLAPTQTSIAFTPGAATPAQVDTLAPTPTPRANTAANGDDTASLDALLKTDVHERDLVALTKRLKKVTQPIPGVVNATPPNYKVGDQRVLWIADQPAKKNFTTTATLRYATTHVYAWAQNGERVDDNALKKSTDVFETKIYPTDRQFFGSERSPGIDNDTHVNIFNGNVPGVGGYFSSADEYPNIVNPYSNQGNWFYINTRDVRPGTSDYEGVLAHEFQHMIHWNQDRNEDTWVNEGLSELAMRLNGYSVGGSDTAFVRDPDVQLDAWRDDPNDAVPHYGASFLFQSYFLSRFGDKLMQDVVHEQANGIQGYDNVLSRNRSGVTFDDVFRDWLVANVLNDSSLDNKRYAYADLRSKVSVKNAAGSFPFDKTFDVHEYAGQYVDLKPTRTGNYVLDLQGATTVRIANTDPHSGRFVWYSNRGDDSDMTLTHAFDLKSVSKATLDVWLWYDIEKDFDYAYVEVSADNGATWDTLKGAHTTDSNPNGNNFGNGFTGRDAKWYEEKFDLSAYAGKQVLVRFEYLTDDAFNATGLLVDDVSIPELNYKDDVENGDGGWQADGFVRDNNYLPQKWSVQVIKFGRQTSIDQVALDGNGHAQVTLQNFGGDVVRAMLVISGLSPVTTETAKFTVNISQQ